MLFARRGKQGRREENSEDALANERTHNALAQLSVSRRACKAKAQWYGAIQFTRRAGPGAPDHSIKITITSTSKSKSQR
jgi:hypothetical protein